MIRNILYLLVALSFTSCVEEEIGEYYHKNDGEYQMSAIISTADSLAHIKLNQVCKYIIKPVTNAEIDVMVNGEKRHTLTYDKYKGYEFKPDFHPGDEMELVAHIGQDIVTSRSSCLVPLEIVSIDTTAYSVKISDYMGYDYLHRVRITVRKPKGASRNGNYYRLEVVRHITQQSYYTNNYNDETGEREIEWHYYTYKRSEYTYANDVALNNGQVDMGDDAPMEFFSQQPNRYGVFTDDFFDGDTYTLVVDVPNELFCWACSMECRISTISADEYYYLKSVVASQEDIEISDGSPVVRSNVNGGFGFVGLESTAVSSLSWEPKFDASSEMLYY